MKRFAGFTALLILSGLSGCSDETVENSTNTTTKAKKATEPPKPYSKNQPTVTIAGGAATLADGYTLNGQQVAKGYGMTYSENVMAEQIPALPIFGFANGQPFNGKTIVFREDHKGRWYLEISDYVFDPRKGPAAGRIEKSDLQTVNITLPNEPDPDEVMIREMEYGGGHFQIKKTPESTGTTSWNTTFGYKLEIDQWQKGESQLGSCGRHKLGSAKGRIFASFRGSEIEGRVRNSWVSGQFENAAILYCGNK